jgi:hypothetical protein
VPLIVMLVLLSPLAAVALPRDIKAVPTPTPAPAPSVSSRLAGIAPADRYFGSLGMSPLSIRSTIGLLGRAYHARTISDHDLLHKAVLTEDALRKWRTAYPADPWLAPTFFHLEQLYQAVQSAEARKHATAVLKSVVLYYPNTKEGHMSRSRLSAGFPPLVAETPVVAPSAPPSPSDAMLAAPGASPPAAPASPVGPSPAAAAPSAAPN